MTNWIGQQNDMATTNLGWSLRLIALGQAILPSQLSNFDQPTSLSESKIHRYSYFCPAEVNSGNGNQISGNVKQFNMGKDLFPGMGGWKSKFPEI